MFVTCKSNDAFEDQLTTGKKYTVVGLGENSYLISNDKGEERWYGRSQFVISRCRAAA